MKNWMKLTAGLATASVLAACSGGGGDSAAPSTAVATKSLSVSGTVSGLTLASHKPFGLDLGVGTFAVNTMRCVPGSGPNVAGEGAIGVDGTFRLTIAGMQEGAALGCWIFLDGVPSIPMAFASATSFDGSTPKQQLGYAPKSNATDVALGTVTITPMTTPLGTFTVAVVVPSNIVDNGGSAAASFADMTGSWSTSVVEDSAANFIHPCDMESDYTAAQIAACKSEWATQAVFINNFGATKTGEEARRGISLWASKAAFDACGQREGVTIDAAWTVGGTYSAGVKTAFAAAAFDATQAVTSDMLLKAPFQKSVEGGHDNCQNSPACETATNCSELVAGIVDTAQRPGAGLSCVLSSMNSGGNNSYQWGAGVCSRRAQVDWNMMYPNPGPGPVDSDGKCATQDCGGAIQWKADPTFRYFSSELLTTGNVGSASVTEEDNPSVNGNTCDLLRTNTFTITQNSATSAALLVEFNARAKPGGAWHADCEGPTNWWANELNKTVRMKINLTKQ